MSKGAGDLNIQAVVSERSLLSETYSIEDCLFYGINTNAFIVPSNTTFTSDGVKITATTNTNGEKLVYFDHSFSNTDEWLFETEIAQLGVSQSVAMVWNDNSFWGGQDKTYSNNAYSDMSGNSNKSHTFAVGDKYKVIRQNGVTTAYINDETIQSKTISHKTTFKIGYFININRTQY